jgi:hypothetical protein
MPPHVAGDPLFFPTGHPWRTAWYSNNKDDDTKMESVSESRVLVPLEGQKRIVYSLNSFLTHPLSAPLYMYPSRTRLINLTHVTHSQQLPPYCRWLSPLPPLK